MKLPGCYLGCMELWQRFLETEIGLPRRRSYARHARIWDQTRERRQDRFQGEGGDLKRFASSTSAESADLANDLRRQKKASWPGQAWSSPAMTVSAGARPQDPTANTTRATNLLVIFQLMCYTLLLAGSQSPARRECGQGLWRRNPVSELSEGKFFYFFSRNPLKSPNSAKEKQGNASIVPCSLCKRGLGRVLFLSSAIRLSIVIYNHKNHMSRTIQSHNHNRSTQPHPF
jgi:hypothetical protein